MLPTISGTRTPLTIHAWESERRLEILRLFEEHVYGVTPKETRHACAYALSEARRSEDGKTDRYDLYTEIAGAGIVCGFHTDVYVPVEAEAPLPTAIMTDTFSLNEQVSRTEIRAHGQMPFDMLNAAGIIGVHAHVDALCIDDPEACREGLLAIYPPKGASGWGAIGAWAWAVSRVVDFLVEWPRVNPRQIAICGCSRAGKAALWCAAQDERIALTISNVSGCTGAAITRGKTGERVRDITSRFPHWTCPTYATYADDEERMPVDQHMLLALCAPRPLYVSSASEDDWADPRMEFASAGLAGEIHRLYGRTGLAIDAFPPVNTPSLEGDVAYHNREGGHGCTEYDWEQYIRFMCKYFT
ncbi:acetylxylan esterase [Eubacteriales bacterium OttesenSCG-928-A19]|nr:acetylxylan esterase [Eubacteriales bacterium OttesenSCG-928-A19]